MFSRSVPRLAGSSNDEPRRLTTVAMVVLLMLITLASAQMPMVPGQQPPEGFPGGVPPQGVQGGFGRGVPGQGQQGFPGGPQGFGGSSDRLEILEQFDLDGSGFLEAEERTAAKEHLASIGWNSGSRRGGFGGGFGGGSGSGTAGSPGVTITPDAVEEYPDAAFYDTQVVRTIFVELGFDDWEAEMEAFYNTDVELPATVTVDGVTYENVGVRFRGNSSYSMVSSGLRRPLRLKFDAAVSGQNLAGVRNVKLLNGVNDASNLRTVLMSTIMQNYIEVPRVNFVRVVINGENWGVYQSQQHFNRDFLEDWYGESDGVRWEIDGSPNGQGGMLYLGDDPDLYRDVYSIQNRDTEASWAALINLFRVLSQTPLDELVAELEPLLDIDGVLKYLALDVALVNSDGFWARASDYELYLDESGRFHMINHDINEALSTSGGFGGGRGEAGSGGTSLDPLVGLNDASMPLRSRLLAVPELQKRYLEIMLDIAETWLDWETLGPVAQQYHDLIDADMAIDTRSLFTYEQFHSSLTTLQAFVAARQEYLLDTLPSLIARIDEPSYQPVQPAAVGTVAALAADAQANNSLRIIAAQDYAEQTGPEGWHLTAGTGTVMTILTDADTQANVFAFGNLTEGFGDSKLDQCVPVDAGQDLSISITAMASTATVDASGVALRINPNFHDSLDACLTALATDSGASRLTGGRNDADIDHPFGSAGGLVFTVLDTTALPELNYAANVIPEGTTYMRLSIRARNRSGAEYPTTVLVSSVSVVQAGAELIVNGDFGQQ